MSVYPSLEDMIVNQMAKIGLKVATGISPPSAPPPYDASVSASAPDLSYPIQPSSAIDYTKKFGSIHPNLDEYTGFSLTQNAVSIHMPTSLTPYSSNQVSVPAPYPYQMIAPISGDSFGLRRAQVIHGIREITLCKDENGKVGIKVQPIAKGIFVSSVRSDSSAALAGLRFGDQILQINGVLVSGFNIKKVHNLIKKTAPQIIKMAIRDRPFERTLTLLKDNVGHCGFLFKNGIITTIVKDSSAARNGLLTGHHLLEVNGQNVVGLTDKEILQIIEFGGNVITITIMPSFVCQPALIDMASSIKNKMDHSLPDI